MANGNEIGPSLGDRASLFFRDARQNAEKPVLYSLENEFAKTKKRKNILFYAGFILFLAALIVLTIVITNSYQRKSQEIKIEVSDFRDLHLADVLERTKKDESRLNRLKQEIADLRRTYQTERQKARARFTSERAIFDLKDFADDEEREEAAKLLETEERQAYAAIDARYGREIGRREQEINEIQGRISTNTQALATEASGSDFVLESGLQVRELETQRLDETWRKRVEDEQDRYTKTQEENRALMQRMTDSLVLRYNPLFREQELLALFPEGAYEMPSLPRFSSFSPLLVNEVATASSDFDEVQQNAREGRMLLKRVYDIGYTNSVAPALLALAHRENNLIDGYERLWQGIERRLAYKNTQVRALVNTLDLALQQAKVQGYVVDAADPARMLVVLSSKLNLEEWIGANVIRAKDNKQIGRVRFEQTRDGMFAIPMDAPLTQAAEPFDRLQMIKK